MSTSPTQPGTPPVAPGQAKEEPEFRLEDDIPSDDKPSAGEPKDKPAKPERE